MTSWRVGVGEAAFDSHADAVEACKSILSAWFEVIDEVALTSNQLTGKPLKVDLLAIPRAQFGYIVGLEVKRGFYRMSEYSHALKQAADYRLGEIDDSRLPMLAHRRISASFVFPRWRGGHDTEGEYSGQALGMEILAHHFRVGAADYNAGEIALLMNNQRLWSRGEWSGNSAGVLGGKERIGSLKMMDPARGRTPGLR